MALENGKKNGRSVVRLEAIELRNFKNVEYGRIEFSNPRTMAFDANILALYGQNGSGKTSLIDAVLLLKHLMSGKSVPNHFADAIALGASGADLRYEFSLRDSAFAGDGSTDHQGRLVYEVSLARKEKKDVFVDDADAMVWNGGAQMLYLVRIQGEKLLFKAHGKRQIDLFDSFKDSRTFAPERMRESLIGRSDEAAWLVRNESILHSRSFAFSRNLLSLIVENGRNDVSEYFLMLNSFAQRNLFVVRSEAIGLSSLNVLPLSFQRSDSGMELDTIYLHTDRTDSIPQQVYEVAREVIGRMNFVLDKIVPGLTIGIENLGTELDKNGVPSVRIELVSYKNGKGRKLPLRFESDGIKKIISVLNLLIGVYNRSDLVVAIDELDAGVFEYLLGELLSILSERGKGQLVFTSHNLRPLETLDRGFVAFTTTNPRNRYVRMQRVGHSNNLRDFYYRDIILGEQKEELYKPTQNGEISLAFRQAGGDYGS